MDARLVAAGLALAFLATAMPGAAYHIQRDPAAADGSGFQPLEWGGRLGVAYPANDPLDNAGPLCSALRAAADTAGLVDPTLGAVLHEALSLVCMDDSYQAGDSAFGFTACESNPEAGAPGHSGLGGLCFMSAGFKDPLGNCVFDSADQGNSNGWYDPYSVGAHPCEPYPSNTIIDDVAYRWYEVTMQLVHPTPFPGTAGVAFTMEIGGLGCSAASDRFVYDEQFAQTLADGHVTGYPLRDPPLGTFGGYWIQPGSTTGLTACAPFPIFY